MAQQDALLSPAIAAIGETPLVELARLTRGVDGCILAKLDYLNPGFSKERPHCPPDDRRCRGGWAAAAGPDGRRAHQRQHRVLKHLSTDLWE
jgi:hypothetical protein